MQVETTNSFVWMPPKFVTLYGTFGVQMYDMMTWLALIGGTIGWLFLTRKVTVPRWKKLLALVIIGVCALIFTRLFHILWWGLDQTIARPHLLLQVKKGRSIHGTLFGFGVAAILVSRLWKKPVAIPASAIGFWPILSLICARIGNFWNSEMIGTPSSWPFAVGFYHSGDRGAVLRHPVQLYEAGLAAILLAIMIFLHAKKNTLSTKFPFLLPSIALTGYSLIRFCCDFVKEEAGFIWGTLLSTGQWISIPFFVFGVWLILPLHQQKPSR